MPKGPKGSEPIGPSGASGAGPQGRGNLLLRLFQHTADMAEGLCVLETHPKLPKLPKQEALVRPLALTG